MHLIEQSTVYLTKYSSRQHNHLNQSLGAAERPTRGSGHRDKDGDGDGDRDGLFLRMFYLNMDFPNTPLFKNYY